MKCGSLEVSESNGMFLFTFHGPHGARGLGAAPDLKSFAANRLSSGMASAELKESLQKLQRHGEAHAWDFKAMDRHPAAAADQAVGLPPVTP